MSEVSAAPVAAVLVLARLLFMGRRYALHILGPFAIVTGSLALSRWARPEATHRPSKNQAVASETKSSKKTPSVLSEARRASLAKACKRKADELKQSLGEDCRVLVRSPFVVAGDLTDEELVQWHDETIGPASRAMAHAYFNSPPTEPIAVLLFRGEQSYNDYARQLFGDEGISVYGYYKPQQRTLVMNIGTGGGTLVHELTHALIDFDFDDVPNWFNEGLASLHEQCRIRADESGIDGLVNWRLPALKKAIESQSLRPLRDLIEADDFRTGDVGLNYAQARYFCLYMQQQGVLAKFYEAFRSTHEKDPQGAAAIERVFSGRTWEQLDADFREWALELKQE